MYHSVSCRQIGNHAQQKSHCFNFYCCRNVVQNFGKNYNKYRKQLTETENIEPLFQTLKQNLNKAEHHNGVTY